MSAGSGEHLVNFTPERQLLLQIKKYSDSDSSFLDTISIKNAASPSVSPEPLTPKSKPGQV